MKDYVIANIKECCDAFQDLLLSGNYLSKKDVDRFLDKYEDIFYLIKKGYISKSDILYKKINSIVNDGYNVVAKRNDVFVKKTMKELSSYFDDIFVNIDPSIRLNKEQRKAIICDEDYSLVVAPPGTGKTTMAVAKIKYLIEQKKVDSSSIIYVCSTKKKAREVKDIFKEIFDLDIKILLIDDLALYFLDSTYKESHNISTLSNLKKLIYGYIKNVIFTNKEKLELFCNCFKDISFNKKYLDYQTYNDYYKNYVNEQYEMYKDNLDNYILNKISSMQKEYTSIKGELLRSIDEVDIANYLYVNGIDYEYYIKENIDDYVADFIINSNGKNIYIEYYGLTSQKQDGTYLIQDTNLKRNFKIKQNALRKKYGDNLIELYNNIDYTVILKNELDKRGIKNKAVSKKQIFNRLMEYDKGREFDLVVDYIAKFIKYYKEDNKKINEFDSIIREQSDNNTRKQLIFIRDIYECYEDYLLNNNMVDYNDLINKATGSLDKLKHDNNINISYLIIDDYQNMSLNHNVLAKKISDLFDTKIVALGDNWETLFSLCNNDIDVFKEFYDIMGYADIMKISTLYRCSHDVINVGTNYVGSDLSIVTQSLVSSLYNKPVEVSYYNRDDINDKYLALSYVINKIYRSNKDSKILILGTSNKCINKYVDAGYFKKGHDGLLIYNNNPKVHIDYRTVLGSQGLEYDEVILLSDKKYVFNNDDELFSIFDNSKKELIDNPEDRRTFYIALTRSKDRLYIISPSFNLTDKE